MLPPASLAMAAEAAHQLNSSAPKPQRQRTATESERRRGNFKGSGSFRSIANGIEIRRFAELREEIDKRFNEIRRDIREL